MLGGSNAAGVSAGYDVTQAVNRSCKAEALFLSTGGQKQQVSREISEGTGRKRR